MDEDKRVTQDQITGIGDMGDGHVLVVYGSTLRGYWACSCGANNGLDST